MYGLEYSPEIEQSIMQVELKDITQDVISILFPPIPARGNIQFRSSQVFGIMGLGKTSLYRAIAVFAYNNYNSNLDNINLIIHESLDVLIAHVDSKPVQVLFVDDAGPENQAAAKELIGKFHSIRHIFKKKRKAIGKSNGVIVVLFAVQDIYLITKKLRGTVHVDIYKNAPTNDHDKGRLSKKIGPVALKKLESISTEVFKKHNYDALSECVVSTICGDIGFITFDFISEEDSIITEIEADVELVIEHEWTDLDVFKWHEPLYQAMKTSNKIIVQPPKPERVSDYAEYFHLLIMQQQSTDDYEVEQLLGSKGTINRQKKNALIGQRMNNGWRENKGIKDPKNLKRHPIFGWIINKRGEELFEDYVLFVLEKLKGEGDINVNFNHKPKIIVPMQRIPGEPNIPPKVYVDDLIFYLVPDDKENSIVINLKCGKGKDSYQWKSFQTTHLATTVGYQAAVLYYDLETDLCLIFYDEVYKKSNIAVSGEMSINQGMTLTNALKTIANRLNPSPLPKTTTATDHPQVQLIEKEPEKEGGLRQ